MLLAIAIFALALVQDLLLTAWTRAVARRQVGAASLLSFLTSGIAVSLYGTVVNTGDPVLHVLAWASGSAVGCWVILRWERPIHEAAGHLIGRCRSLKRAPGLRSFWARSPVRSSVSASKGITHQGSDHGARENERYGGRTQPHTGGLSRRPATRH